MSHQDKFQGFFGTRTGDLSTSEQGDTACAKLFENVLKWNRECNDRDHLLTFTSETGGFIYSKTYCHVYPTKQ